jgi:hypothetical protein
LSLLRRAVFQHRDRLTIAELEGGRAIGVLGDDGVIGTIQRLPTRHVFTREELFEVVWEKDYEGNSRALNTAVAALRRKLAKRDYLIETVHGVGYKLDV